LPTRCGQRPVHETSGDTFKDIIMSLTGTHSPQ